MSKKERESGRKWDGRSRISNDKYKKNWEEIYGQREQEELNESMKEAFRQRDERKKKEETNEPKTRLEQITKITHDPIAD